MRVAGHGVGKQHRTMPAGTVGLSQSEVNMIDHYRDHAANERTYLAWVRTGITVMVLGFIVEKFEIFLASLQGLLADKVHVVVQSRGPELVSLALVSVGVLVIVAGAVRFFRVKSRLCAGDSILYRGTMPAVGLTFVLLAFGIYLLLYLAALSDTNRLV